MQSCGRASASLALGSCECSPPIAEPLLEVMAAITRLTRGNFRLLDRLLTQMQRVLTINGIDQFSLAVVETARENLVIGEA